MHVPRMLGSSGRAAALLAVVAVAALLAGSLLWARVSSDAPIDREEVAQAFVQAVVDGDTEAATAFADPQVRAEWTTRLDAPIAWVREHEAAVDHIEVRVGDTFVATLPAETPTEEPSLGSLSVTVDPGEGGWRVTGWSWSLRSSRPSPPPVVDHDEEEEE